MCGDACHVWCSCRVFALRVNRVSIAVPCHILANQASNNCSTCSCCRTDKDAPQCMPPLPEQSSERFHRPWTSAKVLPLQQTVVPLVRLLHADLSIRDATESASAHQSFASFTEKASRCVGQNSVTWRLRTATRGQGKVITVIRVWRRWVPALRPAARSARSRGARRRPAGAA